MARSHLTQEAIGKIIASQAGREHRLRAADLIIFNVGLSLEELADEARQIIHHFGLSSL
jgi:dephospho-CoA kinase